jgi:hypothetical protein
VAARRGPFQAQARSGTGGTYRWKTPCVRRTLAVDAAWGKRATAFSEKPGRPGRPEVATKAFAVISPDSCPADNAGTSCCSLGKSLWNHQSGEHGCSGLACRQVRYHPGPGMPATATRRRRGRSGVGARAHTRVLGFEGLRWSKRRKPSAWELETSRMLVTTSRLQKLVRGISSRQTGGFVLKGRLE